MPIGRRAPARSERPSAISQLPNYPITKLQISLLPTTLAGYIDSRVTLSIGVAIFPDDADSSESLLVQADKALFFAKSQGRNNVQIYSRIRDNDLGNRQVDMTSRLDKASTWKEFDRIADQQSVRVIDKQ